jgi:hypothetical protein
MHQRAFEHSPNCFGRARLPYVRFVSGFSPVLPRQRNGEGTSVNNSQPYTDAHYLAELKSKRRALQQRLDALRLLPDNEWIRDLIRMDEGRIESLDQRIRVFDRTELSDLESSL